MDWNLIVQILPAFAQAGAITLLVSAGAVLVGVVLGFWLNVVQDTWLPFRRFYSLFVWFFRGTPFLIQLFVSVSYTHLTLPTIYSV